VTFTPICWRHVVSVSTQTDLLEKCRVSVYTNRFAGEMSCQCLNKPICWRNVVSVSKQTDLLEKCRVSVYTKICWRNVVSISTQTDLLEKCRVSVYTNRFAGDMSCKCLHTRNNSKRESPCVHTWKKNYLTY
jgi:hypothetical protein